MSTIILSFQVLQSTSDTRKWREKATAYVLMFAIAVFGFGTPVRAGDDHDRDNECHSIKTASPIKHVIIIVGENRSFDHLFATYVPTDRRERVLNLLSEGIVNADGTPGPNFAKASQFKIVSAPNGGKFFSSAGMANKELYSTLPAPDVGGVGPVSPYAAILGIPGGDPGQPLGFADQVFFSDGKGNPATPAAANIYNPDPQAGTLDLYTHRAQWFNCSDTSQPGIAAITNYLNALPYDVQTKCGPGEYWQAVNVNPAFTPKGLPQTGLAVPPTMQQSIGDVLSAHNIPWKYYGGGFNADGTTSPFNGSYCNICNPFEYESNYPSVVAEHMRDVTDLFTDLKNGTLPAVSYVKPDGTMDGHPASSKWTLFEAFAQNIIDLAQSNPRQWAETAIFVTVDEGGGYYDSGFIQPVDFFGTGPRIPMIAISRFSTGGHISHVYSEHSSFVKFVERNWMLHTTLSDRSRDNLSNPVQNDHSYVPRNMPAIGDLFDLFDFDRHDDGHRDGGDRDR